MKGVLLSLFVPAGMSGNEISSSITVMLFPPEIAVSSAVTPVAADNPVFTAVISSSIVSPGFNTPSPLPLEYPRSSSSIVATSSATRAPLEG